MATPCKKCGAEKTETIGHGLMYSIAKMFDYRLRICSRCHRYRLLPRQGERPSKPEPAVSKTPEPGACPQCGQKDYRRSRRYFWERLISRGPMVRCRACRKRFPMPRLAT